MERRQSLIVIFGLFILAIVSISVVLFSGHQATFNALQAYSESSDISAMAQYGSNSLVYSNGTNLALYDYTSGQISQLSPGFGVSGYSIDSVSVTSDNSFIIFHAQSAGVNNSLTEQFQTNGTTSPFGYWIVYNTTSRTFSALPSSVVSAKASGTNVAALQTSTNGEQISVYNPSSLSVTKSIDVPGSVNFLVTDNGFLIQNTSNNLLITKDGVVSEPVASNASIIGSVSQQQVLLSINQGSAKQLGLLNLQNDKIQHLASSNVVGTPVINNGVVLYTSSSSGSRVLYTYDLVTHKNLEWSFNGQLKNMNLSAMEAVTPISDRAAIISLSNSSYYLVGQLAKPSGSL